MLAPHACCFWCFHGLYTLTATKAWSLLGTILLRWDFSRLAYTIQEGIAQIASYWLTSEYVFGSLVQTTDYRIETFPSFIFLPLEGFHIHFIIILKLV